MAQERPIHHAIVMKAIKARIPRDQDGPMVVGLGRGADYPDLCVNTDQVPALSGFKAGEKLQFMVEGEIRHRIEHEDVHDDGKKPEKRENFIIRITKIGLEK